MSLEGEKMNILEANPHETMLLPLVGTPIRHSTASSLYNYLCNRYNINALFFPKEIMENELEDFFRACKLLKFHGVILTMPHKGSAVNYVDTIDDVSKAFRSVNCIRFDGKKTIGHGFDGKGVVYAFDQKNVDLKGKEVIMLGSGGVGGIFAAEMASRGIKKLTILNRTISKAERIAGEMKKMYINTQTSYMEFTPQNIKKAVSTADIFLQATPLGMLGKEDFFDLSFIDEMPQNAWVMDAVSNPPETSLIKRAKARGLNTILGMDMLVCQMEAIIDFLFDIKIDKNGRKAAYDFYCKLFNYEP
jgi:shikimate dehydrogenase